MAEIGTEPPEAAVNSENPEERALDRYAWSGREDILGETPRNKAESGGNSSEKDTAEGPREIFRVMEVVERNSAAIAESYASLFSNLRLALSEVTSTSLENMQCLSDVVGSLQVSALDAATKGNRYINSFLSPAFNYHSMWYSFAGGLLGTCYKCSTEDNFEIERRNEEYGRPFIETILRKNVDTLEMAVDRLLRSP